jgi:hypothetical protein
MSAYHMFTNELENSTGSYILAADLSGKHAKNLTKEDRLDYENSRSHAANMPRILDMQTAL